MNPIKIELTISQPAWRAGNIEVELVVHSYCNPNQNIRAIRVYHQDFFKDYFTMCIEELKREVTKIMKEQKT